jgi:hypothetical protein
LCQPLEFAVERLVCEKKPSRLYIERLLSGLREVGAKVLTPIGGAPRHGWRAVRLAAQGSANGYERHHQE